MQKFEWGGIAAQVTLRVEHAKDTLKTETFYLLIDIKLHQDSIIIKQIVPPKSMRLKNVKLRAHLIFLQKCHTKNP